MSAQNNTTKTRMISVNNECY